MDKFSFLKWHGRVCDSGERRAMKYLKAAAKLVAMLKTF